MCVHNNPPDITPDMAPREVYNMYTNDYNASKKFGDASYTAPDRVLKEVINRFERGYNALATMVLHRLLHWIP